MSILEYSTVYCDGIHKLANVSFADDELHKSGRKAEQNILKQLKTLEYDIKMVESISARS